MAAEPRPLERIRFCVETAAGIVWEQRGAADAMPVDARPDPSWSRRVLAHGFAGAAAGPLIEFDAPRGGRRHKRPRAGVRRRLAGDGAGGEVLRTAVELRNEPSAGGGVHRFPGPGQARRLTASTTQDPEAQ
jgi:hypothetical protein